MASDFVAGAPLTPPSRCLPSCMGADGLLCGAAVDLLYGFAGWFGVQQVAAMGRVVNSARDCVCLIGLGKVWSASGQRASLPCRLEQWCYRAGWPENGEVG